MLQNVPALSLLPFFALEIDCFSCRPGSRLSKTHQLPSLAPYFGEEEFVTVYLGWNEEGLLFRFDIRAPVQKCLSDFRRGDSAEVFLDMRDVKTTSAISSYHHHFVFFPEAVGGVLGKEVTRFGQDDMHALCNPSELHIDAAVGHKGYVLEVAIPRQALHGYDPSRFDRFGFTYKINRFHAPAQHFSVMSEEYVIERNSPFWATMIMRKK